MTGQVLFDSHVALLLEGAVSFVNELTEGERRGKPYPAPADEALPTVAAAAIPTEPQRTRPSRLPRDAAVYLADAARVMRRVFEAMVWLVAGLAGLPSVWFWQRVAVRIGLSHGVEACRGTLTQLGLLLPVPPSLAAALKAADAGSTGYVMRDIRKIAGDAKSTIASS